MVGQGAPLRRLCHVAAASSDASPFERDHGLQSFVTTSSLSELDAPGNASRHSSPELELPSYCWTRTSFRAIRSCRPTTIHPPGMDVLDEVGVGDSVRAVAPPTAHHAPAERTTPSSTLNLPAAELMLSSPEARSTVSYKTRQRRLAPRSLTERG